LSAGGCSSAIHDEPIGQEASIVYFRQILHDDLGCASYLLADAGEAAVVDPKWEVEEYLNAARQAGAVIRHVLETHHHADHVSGRDRLAAATGAAIHLPADPGLPGSAGLRDGDTVHVGRLHLRALAAPGHRPEHLAYQVLDATRATGETWLLLSGDSLLVGDVARPDLAVPGEDGARGLWETLRRIEALGDHVELWPAHVGGSLCGSGSLSAKTSSTVGYERRANPLLSLGDADDFVAELTRSVPPRPPTVERVVALNQTGPGDPPPLHTLTVARLAQLVRHVCLLDVRPAEAFDAGHLAGALNLPAGGRGLGTRAGWAAGVQQQIVIVADSRHAGEQVADCLYAAGLWNAQGITIADPPAWERSGLDVRTAGALTPERLVPSLARGELELIDVRDRAEWRAAHIDNSLHLPLAELGDGCQVKLPRERPLAIACATGGRAALAASALRRRGHAPVSRVVGGVTELARHGATLVSTG
jgi:hydroxyacylglutathione hydrolase